MSKRQEMTVQELRRWLERDRGLVVVGVEK